MGLTKNITQNDEINTSYHRILFLQITPKNENSVAVVSYVNKTARLKELNDGCFVYSRAKTYIAPYDKTRTIEEAYAYLKTRPEFQGATDVFEEGQAN